MKENLTLSKLFHRHFVISPLDVYVRRIRNNKRVQYEADAVILVDIPNPAGHRYFTVNDLYVGMSRVKHNLTILTRDEFIDPTPLLES